jgi:gas vesicle protein
MTGALLGLVVGLLVAPAKGADTREQIADTAEKWKHSLDRLIGKAGMELEDLKALFEQEIAGLSADVRHRILTILEESKNSAARMRGEISNGVL